MATATAIRHYLLNHSPWVDPDNTVDRILYGDPDRRTDRVAVTWYPAIETLRAAHDAGCGIVVSHEPLFWKHREPDPLWYDKRPGIAKKAFLDETGMTVLRAHDSWDQWPDAGIRDSLARFLGLSDPVAVWEKAPAVLAVYAIEPQPLRQFAQHVADRVAALGEDSVRVTGDPDRIVSRPSIGVGCFCPNADMVEQGGDVLVVCYDGASYWEARERLHEMNAAVIAIEHGTSEMPGIESLARHLGQAFPDTEFLYFAEHARPWTVMGR